MGKLHKRDMSSKHLKPYFKKGVFLLCNFTYYSLIKSKNEDYDLQVVFSLFQNALTTE